MNRDLLSAVVIAIGCLLVFVLVMPQYNAISVAGTALAEREALVAERQAQLKNVTELAARYDSQRTAIANLGWLVPEKKQLDQIIVGLEAAAQSSGLQTSELAIAADNVNAGGPFSRTNLRVNLAGNYPSLVAFLKQVEQSLRIYDVAEVSISKNANGTGFSLEIKLNTYSKK